MKATTSKVAKRLFEGTKLQKKEASKKMKLEMPSKGDSSSSSDKWVSSGDSFGELDDDIEDIEEVELADKKDIKTGDCPSPVFVEWQEVK